MAARTTSLVPACALRACPLGSTAPLSAARCLIQAQAFTKRTRAHVHARTNARHVSLTDENTQFALSLSLSLARSLSLSLRHSLRVTRDPPPQTPSVPHFYFCFFCNQIYPRDQRSFFPISFMHFEPRPLRPTRMQRYVYAAHWTHMLLQVLLTWKSMTGCALSVLILAVLLRWFLLR